jgi:hypothetical protein
VRGWVLRAERHSPARAFEQFVQQTRANTRATGVCRNEQVAKHRDPFDVDHARKVLAAFGRAFGKLPEDPGGRSQEAFNAIGLRRDRRKQL